MESRPVIIEQEISISKKKLSDLLSGEKKFETFTSEGNYSSDFVTESQLTVCCDKDSDNNKDYSVSARLEFSLLLDGFDEKCRGQIVFHNESANIVAIEHLNVYLNGDLAPFDYTIRADFCKLSDILNEEKKMCVENKSYPFAKSFIIKMKGLLFLISSRQCNYPIPNQKSELNLAKYLWERDDRDYILSVGKKNEQKTEVKIHKLILASRSPVFDRMLQTEMKEKSEGKVEIIDFDPETVKIAVEFFYDRENDECLNVGLLIDLLQFAEKYDVQDLKGKTEIILCKKLRPHNICQISNGSVISNATMLKDACIQTMLFYMNKKIPFDEAITLNKNFSAEVIHAGSLLVENRLQ